MTGALRAWITSEFLFKTFKKKKKRLRGWPIKTEAPRAPEKAHWFFFWFFFVLLDESKVKH